MSSPAPRTRGRPKDEGLAERRREEILDVAATIFAERGYPGTEVQFVADALGVGKGTVYRYFPSKEALFLAAVDRGMRRLTGAIDASVDGVEDTLDHMKRAIRAYLTFFKDNPQYAELLIQERAEFRDRKRNTYFEHRNCNAERWDERMRGLIAAGRIREMPIARMRDVLGDLVYGTMFTNHFSGRHKPLEEQARDIIDVVFHGILTPAESRRQQARSDG
jgi:AcrR family transcriptional regulator